MLFNIYLKLTQQKKKTDFNIDSKKTYLYII